MGKKLGREGAGGSLLEATLPLSPKSRTSTEKKGLT